ncbi:MAG: transferase [Cyanobacteria bacterium P01_C01_bin.72]
MIYLPPPQPTPNKDIRVSGDVEIHPTASLAPGTILQAAPNHKIVIGVDVCIGMGVIINAAQGSVEIDSGAIVGAGVLIIGASRIGNNCCIGTSSTIFQVNVSAMVVIEPGSVLGDSSRQVEPSSNAEPKTKTKATSTLNGKSSSPASCNSSNNYSYVSQPQQPDVPKNAPESNVVSSSPPVTPAETVETSTQFPLSQNKPPVVGQLYINELLVTLFPHNKNYRSDSANQ